MQLAFAGHSFLLGSSQSRGSPGLLKTPSQVVCTFRGLGLHAACWGPLWLLAS